MLPLLTLLSLVAAPVAAEPEAIATTVCVACHGPQGHSAIPQFPVLAGQNAEYIAKELDDFASGRRASDAMTAILANVSDSEFEGLAAYYAKQTPVRARTTNIVMSAIGRDIYRRGVDERGIPPCSSCHLERGEGSERYPRIAGQHPEYSLQQLKDFQSGARANDKGRAMRIAVQKLSEEEMRALVAYLAGL